MKKQTKLLAVLSTAALTSALSFPAYAKNAGWAQENGNWYYYDSYGEPLTDTWKKSGDDWYYLDSDGIRATSSQIDEYYVDEDGKRVTMKWISVENEDYWSEQDEPEFLYYYYGRDGRALTSTWASINGQWYYFNEDSIMETGSIQVDGFNYYLGEDGSRKTGWVLLEDETDDPEIIESWYYFDNSGKRIEHAVDKKINGNYYTFVDGKMQTGWVYMDGDPDSASSNTIEHWRYFAEPEIKNAKVGAAISGWLSLEPPERLLDNVDEAVEWYFFNKDGEPKTGPEFGEASTDDFVRIDGKNYLFDQRGNPVKGLHRVEIGDTGEYTSYYFDDDSRTMVKGKRTIEEGDGTKSTFYFNEGSYAGRGFTGVRSNYLYYMGKLQKADSDSRYMLVSLPSGSQYKTYVVNTSGRISKNTTVKDRDGNRYKVNSSGILMEINGEAAGNGLLGDPLEPVYEEFD